MQNSTSDQKKQASHQAHTQMFFIDSKTGKQYTNLDDLPPEMRSRVEKKLGVLKDDDADGIPDVLEQYLPGQMAHFNLQDQNHSHVSHISFGWKGFIKNFFIGLNPFSSLFQSIRHLKNGRHPSSGHQIVTGESSVHSGAPLQVPKTSNNQSEKWKIAVIVLLVLGAVAYFEKDFILGLL